MHCRCRKPARMLILVTAIAVSSFSCNTSMNQTDPPTPEAEQSPDEMFNYTAAREQMVTRQLAARDIVDRRVLDAMRRVPRHQFVPEDLRHRAYFDSPLPIGQEQTISQPYIVALMTQLVNPTPDKRALDIGTGSGYQTAVLAELVSSVHSIEIVEPLAEAARARLQAMGYENIKVRHGDGYHGWESAAPFDIIIVAAAPDHIPPALIEQLAPGGTLVIPVGERFQKLTVVEKNETGEVVQRSVAPVAFVPMTGPAEEM
jgi:protein-L-isoaspartate(D-aspartate) O-methyltransferase